MSSTSRWSAKKLPRLIVLDLDGVIWDGTLTDGTDSVALDHSLISILQELDQRGVLLSCVSKNNSDVAHKVLQESSIDQLFVATEISFAPKPPAVNRILQKVRVQPSDAVFIDDTLREREDVKRLLPGLRCLTPKEAKRLLDKCLNNSSNVANCDSQMRREHYVREEERPFLAASSLADLSQGIASSNLSVYVSKATNRDLTRCAELYSRTHRLNFASRVRALPELVDLRSSERWAVYSIRAVDRYGPYGLVGCAVLGVERSCLIIEDLVLSCRVQARKVEEAVLTDLIKIAHQKNLTKCRIRFVRTQYNSHLEGVLGELSFRPESNPSVWCRRINDNGNNKPQQIMLPTVTWDKPKIESGDGGIPFVREELKQWVEKHGFPKPIASIGSGYDEVLGDNWEHWLAPGTISSSIKRIDIQLLPKIDLVDNAESLSTVPDNSFGTVLCLDMLEHTTSPWKVPATVLRVLQLGGIAVFSVPCILGIHCEEKDFWRLTPTGLRRLVESGTQEYIEGFRFNTCGVWIEGTTAYPIRTVLMARKVKDSDACAK